VSGQSGVIKGRTGSFQGFKAISAGALPVSIDARKPGRVEVVAYLAPQSGGSICGSLQAKVSDVDERFVTISGNTFKADSRGWTLVPANSAELRTAARAAGVGEFFAGLRDGFLRLFGAAPPSSAPVAAKVRSAKGTPQQQVQVIAKDAGVMQMSCGKPVDGSAGLAQTQMGQTVTYSGESASVVTSRVIPCTRNVLLGQSATTGELLADPSALIGVDAASLIGADGASLIGADGASLIGADGASAVPGPIDGARARLVGADGGSLIGADGASLIGADGASLIGADGASAVAAAGAGLVAAGAGNIVAAGAGN
jgi:hypothetical protein